MEYVSNVLGLSRKYFIRPYNIDDVCYNLFSRFREKAVSIAYEKPSCSHMFIVGSNYEIRLFMKPTNEAYLSVLINTGSSLPLRVIGYAQKVFNDVDRLMARFSESYEDINVLFRTAFRCRRVSTSDIEKLMNLLGIVVYAKEVHMVSDIAISVVRGRLVGKNLSQYDVIVTMIENEASEISIAVETRVRDIDSVGRVADVQDVVYSLIESVALESSGANFSENTDGAGV